MVLGEETGIGHRPCGRSECGKHKESHRDFVYHGTNWQRLDRFRNKCWSLTEDKRTKDLSQALFVFGVCILNNGDLLVFARQLFA